MGNRFVWLAALVTILPLVCEPAGAADVETFGYGRWNGTATTDDAGSFARCTVIARFKRASVSSNRDIGAAVTMDRVNGWTIGVVGATSADLATSDTPFRVEVDGTELLVGKPEVAIDQVAVLAVREPERFLAALRKGDRMTISTPADDFVLPLAGVPKALDWIEGCTKRYESFVPPGREKATADAAVLRRDIGTLMQTLLQTVDAKDIQVGPPPGTPAFPSEDKSLPWKAEGMHGEVQVWDGRDPKTLANQIIGSSSGCKRRPDAARGDPAKTAKKKGKPDLVVFAVVDCLDEAGPRRIALVLLPRVKGGIYLISVQNREAGPEAVDRLGERLAEAARRTVLR